MNAPVRVTALSYAALNELLPALEPGQALVYHVGSLAYDRVRGVQFGMVHGAAIAAWEAYQRGEVLLTQRKLKGPTPFTFEYIAIKAAARNAAGVDGKVARQRAHT